MSGKPTVISLFAGCGGSSLGYKWAGFKELLAIDFDSHAVETFKLNFNIPIWQRDIKEITGKEILDFCKIKKGELDVLDGSPPCQGFSTVGKREVSDFRNDLSFEFIRLVKELQPKVFVMENVTGMIKGKMKGLFIEIIRAMKQLEYNVKCKKMNSMYYDVPQSRERLIFIGSKNKNVEFPIPSKEVTTVEDALKNVENKTYLEPNSEYAILMNHIKSGENLSKIKKNSHYSYIKLPQYKPSMTLTKSLCWGKISAWHFKENRNITIEEAKRLCSFPDDFLLEGKYQKQWARLGNSVMPNMMKAIAKTIKIKMLGYI